MSINQFSLRRDTSTDSGSELPPLPPHLQCLCSTRSSYTQLTTNDNYGVSDVSLSRRLLSGYGMIFLVTISVSSHLGVKKNPESTFTSYTIFITSVAVLKMN